MHLLKTLVFHNAYKQFLPSEKEITDRVIFRITQNPDIGKLAKGEIKDVYIYEFRVARHPTLIAYTLDQDMNTVTLVSLFIYKGLYRQ